MTRNEFLEKISKIVIAENNKRKNQLFSSIVIAQALLESNWGQSILMMKAKAVFGIKASKNWKGKVYNAKTQECYDGKTYTNITACFRAYNSLEESVEDYFLLILNSSRYSKAKNCKTPRECIQAIKNGGYATDPNYVNNIMFLIEKNNLTKYDKKESKTEYIIGKTYITLVDLNVRKGAGTNYDKKKYKELTKDAQKHAKLNGVLKKGTKITCQNIVSKDNEIWFKIPSGYICANYKGKEYIK